MYPIVGQASHVVVVVDCFQPWRSLCRPAEFPRRPAEAGLLLLIGEKKSPSHEERSWWPIHTRRRTTTTTTTPLKAARGEQTNRSPRRIERRESLPSTVYRVSLSLSPSSASLLLPLFSFPLLLREMMAHHDVVASFWEGFRIFKLDSVWMSSVPTSFLSTLDSPLCAHFAGRLKTAQQRDERSHLER